MKIQDIDARARTEALCWFNKQCRDTSARHYLYYLPSTAAHDGGFLISRERPANAAYELASPEPLSIAWTVERAQVWIKDIVWRLPILESGEPA